MYFERLGRWFELGNSGKMGILTNFSGYLVPSRIYTTAVNGAGFEIFTNFVDSRLSIFWNVKNVRLATLENREGDANE